MKYKEALKKSMEMLAQDSRVLFIGYNVLHGSKAYGTLKDIPRERCIESPLAENIMADLAIGMSLAGYRPVLFFERHDFLLNASDAIVNHLDKINSLSLGQYNTPVIIRANVGSKENPNAGPQHTQDFTEAFAKMLKMPVIDLKSPAQIIAEYEKARVSCEPVMLVERRELYENEQ